jgi:hypothetical protein
MVGVIRVEDGKVRGRIHKGASCLGSSARTHPCL